MGDSKSMTENDENDISPNSVPSTMMAALDKGGPNFAMLPVSFVSRKNNASLSATSTGDSIASSAKSPTSPCVPQGASPSSTTTVDLSPSSSTELTAMEASLSRSPNHKLKHKNSAASSPASATISTTDNKDSNAVNNGLHHRHHPSQQGKQNGVTAGGTSHSTASTNMQISHAIPPAHSSPTRQRRKARPIVQHQQMGALRRGIEKFQSSRKHRKWTLVQIVRLLLLGGATFYFLIMFRGTQLLMQNSEENYRSEDVTDTPRVKADSPLGLLNPHPNPDINVDRHPRLDDRGYLRSVSGVVAGGGQLSIVRTPSKDDPAQVRKNLEQRASERWKRTRPPSTPPRAKSIKAYQILSVDQSEPERGQQSETSMDLADAARLCGQHAKLAQKEHPESFLQRHVLDSNSRVVITGIVSNSIAFHLALALKVKCGVEVMVGIDPMLPNTIPDRLRFSEQMKILATNIPKMVQPILVPMLGLDPRMKKTKKESSSSPLALEISGELNLLSFKPTHIVHLSSATSSTRHRPPSGLLNHPMSPKQLPSPSYQSSEDDNYEPSIFPIRSSMAAMEQVLASLVSSNSLGEVQPHLTYASSTRFLQSSSQRPLNPDIVHTNTKLMDEVLADTYGFIYGAYSVGVRLPLDGVYGPWDRPGSEMYDLLQATLDGNYTLQSSEVPQHWMYVQDAVEAILTAMQYRSDQSTTLDTSSNINSMASNSDIALMAKSFVGADSTGEKTGLVVRSDEALPTTNDVTLQRFGWTAETKLRDGILRSLAWQMDQANPFGPPLAEQQTNDRAVLLPVQTGDALLRQNSVPTCGPDELLCHVGTPFLPCSSECSTKSQCRASIFDPVKELTRNMTEGCDAVLYSQSLGVHVEDLQLQAQFEDEVEPIICNIAFVAQSSPLVNSVIDKVPSEELARLGVIKNMAAQEKKARLNGRLLYRGWIIIWVDPPKAVSVGDRFLMKLSPGRMFSPDVMYAVFVEENFTVSPTAEDVRFLIGQMDRGATKQRSVYRMVKADEKSKPKKVKYTIPEEPEKRSAVLVSQLKYKISERGRLPQDTKISVNDAVRFMRFEVGSDPTKQKEEPSIKAQKEFYRRIPAFVNSKDLRNTIDQFYKYEMNRWVRTRWVVHDLKLEESRQLRCNWYQEHLQWGTDLDQLSFAEIMAKMEIERRIESWEPDDRVKPSFVQNPELKDFTDVNEWIVAKTEQNKLRALQAGHLAEVEQVPDHVAKDQEEEEGGEEDHQAAEYSSVQKPEVGLYVRIMSDRIMSLSRKAWAHYRAELAVRRDSSKGPPTKK